jgi:hypothetical protein
MLYTIPAVLLILWLLRLVTSYNHEPSAVSFMSFWDAIVVIPWTHQRTKRRVTGTWKSQLDSEKEFGAMWATVQPPQGHAEYPA